VFDPFITLVGPSAINSGSGYISFFDRYGICSSSPTETQEAAWKIIRADLLPADEKGNYQVTPFYRVGGFSLNKEMFERNKYEATANPYHYDYETGEKIIDERPGYCMDNGYEFKFTNATQAEVERLHEYINGIDRIKTYYDPNVLRALNEEVLLCWNGTKTAEETARDVQNRVQLFMNERK